MKERNHSLHQENWWLTIDNSHLGLPRFRSFCSVVPVLKFPTELSPPDPNSETYPPPHICPTTTATDANARKKKRGRWKTYGISHVFPALLLQALRIRHAESSCKLMNCLTVIPVCLKRPHGPFRTLSDSRVPAFDCFGGRRRQRSRSSFGAVVVVAAVSFLVLFAFFGRRWGRRGGGGSCRCCFCWVENIRTPFAQFHQHRRASFVLYIQNLIWFVKCSNPNRTVITKKIVWEKEKKLNSNHKVLKTVVTVIGVAAVESSSSLFSCAAPEDNDGESRRNTGVCSIELAEGEEEEANSDEPLSLPPPLPPLPLPSHPASPSWCRRCCCSFSSFSLRRRRVKLTKRYMLDRT